MSDPVTELNEELELEKLRVLDRQNRRDSNVRIAQSLIVGVPAILTAAAGAALSYFTYLNGTRLENAEKARERIEGKIDVAHEASKEAAGHAATAAEEIRSVKEEMRGAKGEQQ